MFAPEEDRAMLCPVCKVTLTLADRQGIEIDYCPQCRGIWLDRGELDKLIERSEAQVAAAPERASPVAAARPQDERDYREREHRDREKHYRSDDKHGYGHYPRRKKSFLGELLDFD
jgi:Zn-finger nucleic acid-binding protein